MTASFDDYVLVTEEELSGILKQAMDAGDFKHLHRYEQAPDGRLKVPCSIWCEWVDEGYAK